MKRQSFFILMFLLLFAATSLAGVPAYDNYPPIADKILQPDGSIVSIISGTTIAAANAARAQQYKRAPVIALKYLMPDGSIVNGVPINTAILGTATDGDCIKIYVGGDNDGRLYYGACGEGSSTPASETVAGIVEFATDAEMTAGTATDKAITPANAKVELDKKAAVNASTTGSAGSLKSPATTGLLTVTGMGAGTTRNWTVPDADVTIPTIPIGLSGIMTDEQLLCGENTDGTTKAKSCGAPTTGFSAMTIGQPVFKTAAGTVGDGTIVKTIYLPVGYFEDGAAPPAAAAVLASTRKVKTRAFDGASNENLEVSFTVPVDYSSGIKFRFIGYVPGATAPANTEVVAFSLAGCSVANSEVLGCTAGNPATSSLTADANYVQYDRVTGAWSDAITVTGIAAGETVQAILIRLAESTDTYAQDFALAGIEIKYVATFIPGSAY